MRNVAAILAVLALAGCMTSTTQGPRVINIAGSPTPASAMLAGSIEGLVGRTSASYVTLVVHNAPQRNLAKMEQLPDAVASGSGFLLDTKGTVVTAGHVAVERGWLVEARGPDGRIYQGEVAALSNSPDVAIVKLSGMSGAAPVVPAANPCLRPGEPVFSLGKPRALGDVARMGELAAMHFDRPVAYQNFGYPDAMVLKLSTRRGESGGPVFNDRGELVGMLVSTLSDKSSGQPLDLAHALPLPMVARYVCSAVSCPASWKAAARFDTRQCPAEGS